MDEIESGAWRGMETYSTVEFVLKEMRANKI